MEDLDPCRHCGKGVIIKKYMSVWALFHGCYIYEGYIKHSIHHVSKEFVRNEWNRIQQNKEEMQG